MILMGILIAMVLEHYHKIPESNRRLMFYFDIAKLVENKLGQSAAKQEWTTLLLKLLPVPLLLWLLLSSFDGLLFWLINLIISTGVLVHCLGPEILRLRYEHYFDCLKREDYESGFLSLGAAFGDIDRKELPAAVTQLIFKQVFANYFAVIIWFVILGAPGALFYRFLKMEVNRAEGNSNVKKLEYFIDWIPSRVLAACFVLVGSFNHASAVFRRCILDYRCPPGQVIQQVGLAALSTETLDQYGEFSENRHAIDLMERSLVAILVFAAFLTLGGFID